MARMTQTKINLREARLALDLTQEELANIFGINANTLARWERNETGPQAPGMLSLALQTLETRRLVRDGDFLSRKEKTKRSIEGTLNRLRKRVKHPRREKVS